MHRNRYSSSTNREIDMNRQTTQRRSLLSSILKIGNWSLPILALSIVGLLCVEVRSAPKTTKSSSRGAAAKDAAAKDSTGKDSAAKDAASKDTSSACDSKAEDSATKDTADSASGASTIKLPEQMY